LQESANVCVKVPPHGESWELAISRPMSVLEISTGNESEVLTMPASRAPLAVITLNVEPGGWGAEYPSPASARTSPLLASSTATPP